MMKLRTVFRKVLRCCVNRSLLASSKVLWQVNAHSISTGALYHTTPHVCDNDDRYARVYVLHQHLERLLQPCTKLGRLRRDEALFELRKRLGCHGARQACEAPTTHHPPPQALRMNHGTIARRTSLSWSSPASSKLNNGRASAHWFLHSPNTRMLNSTLANVGNRPWLAAMAARMAWAVAVVLRALRTKYEAMESMLLAACSAMLESVAWSPPLI